MKKSITLSLFLTVCISYCFAQTGDPWITKIYNDTWGRNPTAFEYNITNYNNGHWNNYSELMKYVYEFRKNLSNAGISFKYSQKTSGNKLVMGIFQNGIQIAADLISNDGGSIVAQGGGNIISNDGGSIVSPNGGTLISNDGGSIAVFKNTKGAAFGSAYTLASSDTKVVKTSSGGALIIR
jgi:hypothetical protein